MRGNSSAWGVDCYVGIQESGSCVEMYIWGEVKISMPRGGVLRKFDGEEVREKSYFAAWRLCVGANFFEFRYGEDLFLVEASRWKL